MFKAEHLDVRQLSHIAGGQADIDRRSTKGGLSLDALFACIKASPFVQWTFQTPLGNERNQCALSSESAHSV